MKLTIRNRHLAPDQSLDVLIENRLVTLSERVRLDEATVAVERRPEASPQFRVELHLAVPGPDLRAERVDHSPVRAFTRALEDLEARLRERASVRVGRSRGSPRITSRAHTRGARLH
jgi:ribosome-associated translation inhibitor RaiA